MSRSRPLIVIADDDAAIAGLLHELLTDEGYDTRCFSSGQAAYSAIQRQHPDLVILDVQMEQYDSGLRVLKKLRSNPATEQMPVILYTANSILLHQREHEVRAYHADMLEKPFLIEQVLAKVRDMLSPPPPF
jgi:CheY-like chemotaxis protein